MGQVPKSIILHPPTEPCVHTVVPGNTATDNCMLICKDGNRVLTCAELLAMLSPVLADWVRLARAQRAHSDSGSSGGSSSSSGGVGCNMTGRMMAAPDMDIDNVVCDKLELHVRDDEAEEWVHALRLVHPGLMPNDRPKLTWDQSKAVTTLADKYGMSTIKAAGDQKLAEAMASGQAGVIVAGLDAMLQALEFSVQLDLPKLNTCCSVAVGAMFQATDYSMSEGARIYQLLRRLRQFMQARPSKSLESNLLSIMMDLYDSALSHACSHSAGGSKT